MKSAALTVFVALVFLAGIGAGVFLFQQPPAQVAPVVIASATPLATPAATRSPVELELPTSPAAANAAAAATAAPNAPLGPNGGAPGPAAPPSELPPPLSADALREGQQSAAEASEPGNGKVTHLVYEFDSEEERAAWEDKRRAGWQARLQREQDIKLRIMQEKVGLTAAQAGRLREILTAEFEERERLVTALSREEISRATFDEGVDKNLASARAALKQLLTPEQYQAYGQLKPREQVLRTDTAGGY